MLKYSIEEALMRESIWCNMVSFRTMKEMPPAEKPYEKCLKYGAGSLSDTELLAVILRTGSRGVPVTELSRDLLSSLSPQKNLLGLFKAGIPDLMNINGIGKVKAVQIKCILELSGRIARLNAVQGVSLSNPKSIAAYYMESLRHLEQEEIHLMMFNTKNRLLGDAILTKGTVNASLISPREVFLKALEYHAVYLVLVHNHPSGDPAPSKEDLRITDRIKKSGEILGIELLDHVIIGDQNYVSLREQKLL